MRNLSLKKGGKVLNSLLTRLTRLLGTNWLRMNAVYTRSCRRRQLIGTMSLGRSLGERIADSGVTLVREIRIRF
ncbi:rCG64427 [Rattus norvegicus]|uniref:RCG64427 n=1 Tax=Rattus norvegicus TaxID=10116 RepID=A6I7D1_RAT|nr:rCG64427 [Rattus norvegicus]